MNPRLRIGWWDEVHKDSTQSAALFQAAEDGQDCKGSRAPGSRCFDLGQKQFCNAEKRLGAIVNNLSGFGMR